MNFWNNVLEPSFDALLDWVPYNDRRRASGRRTKTTIESLPPDLLLEIAYILDDTGDRLHFALSSRYLYPRVVPSVYTSVVLRGYPQCERTLSMLCDTPTLARHVQELNVYPDYVGPEQPSKYEAGTGMCIGASLLVTKALLNMDALRSFGWHACWGSPVEAMWWTLRRCCLNLQSVHVNFTERLPSPNSPVFMFNDLTHFSLTVKPISFAQGNDLSDREGLAVYNKLWDMLVLRCPRLESLAIQSEVDQPVYSRRLLEGRWPGLRSLTLGPIKFDAQGSEPLNDMNVFLESHPSIEQISLRDVPVDLSILSKDALPRLQHLNGNVDHFRALSVRGLPQNLQIGLHNPQTLFPQSTLSESLQSLTLGELIPLRELTPLSVSGMLAGLHALTSLTAVFTLESGYDSNGVFRAIVSACPQLLHLDLTCTSKPSFYLEAFSRSLRGLTRLRTLSLMIVKVPGDEWMQDGAARIALSNPRLRRFTIAYIPAEPVHRGRPFVRPQPLHEGRFTVLCDAHNIPITMFAYERWKRWGWLGRRTYRRTVVELRPSGHPDAVKKTWGQLLLDRGPAGQEARLLMLSAWLLGLAVWGISRNVLRRLIEAPWRTNGLDLKFVSPL